MRCGLSSGSGDQLCGPLAVLLWSWVFAVLVYWGLVSLPHALSLGQAQISVSQFSVVSMLCCFSDCFSILQCCLTLDVAHWLRRWALWTAICPISGSSLSSVTVSPFAFPVFVYWKFMQRSAPCPSPFLQCTQSTPPPLLHVLFNSLFIIHFFGGGGGQSAQGAMLVYPRGSCGNTMCCLFAHLLVCVAQASLELVSGSVGALLFSQCNVAWRSFVQAGGSGCRGFDSSWWFLSAKCGSIISAKFLIYRDHTVCFCPLGTILDPLWHNFQCQM
jgi:hypothetical protein